MVKQTYTFPLVIERDEDGYFISCPSLQGCYTQGETYEEAMANIADALKLHIEDRIANQEPIPTATNVSVTMVEVAA
ncbi:MAG: type II toxin-antitoxin system HicB family antitoxin [Chloroflexi bacterium]|nr:type II toxin-antitoxin system HicB family antitoxin [Chloroflexota bacterium]